MEGKAKYIFPVLATGLVVFVVSAVVTFTNIGFRADFVTGLIAFPYIRRATAGIVALIERT
jgi:hypothetical protein